MSYRRRRSPWLTGVLVCMLLVGMGILAYPTFSDWWNSYHQSRAVAQYEAAVGKTDQQSIDSLLAEAHAYNQRLGDLLGRFTPTPEDHATYGRLLDLSGDGMMGYLQIPRIGVKLPIYHGTVEQVLQTAVGHLEGSSLPVGGAGTHAVLSGHRGLPSAKLFTDLDQLQEGDGFTINVLGQRICYEVDQIRTVEPGDLSELSLQPGEDYVTLLTCTPYGVNSHRLLVRGHRVPAREASPSHQAMAADTHSHKVALAVLVALLCVASVIMAIRHRR